MFENFLCEKNDEIDNAAYHLACAIHSKSPNSSRDELEWDMAYIGEIVDVAEKILADHGIRHCHPFYEGDDGETPCYLGVDCENTDCPLRGKK